MTDTKTKAVYVRMGEATARKFEKLVELYGSQTQVIAVAIDRLYRAESRAPAADAGGGERGQEQEE